MSHTLPLASTTLVWSGTFLQGKLSILRSIHTPANFFYSLEHHDTSLEGVHIFEDWQEMRAEEIMNELLVEVESKYIQFSASQVQEFKQLGGKLQ